VITAEGRSRCFINAHPATLQQVKSLGERLIDIHSQHAHQSLLLKTTHQRLLDEYSQHLPLVGTVSALYQQWQRSHKAFIALRDNADEMQAHYKLLSYQVEELNQLNLEEGELKRLENEQKQLSNADTMIEQCQQLANACDNNDSGLQHQLQQALRLLSNIDGKSALVDNIDQLLNNALIYVEEAHAEIRHQTDTLEINPERLHEINERLSACYEISRKHHIRPEELAERHQQLSKELAGLSSGDEQLSELQAKANTDEQAFRKKAETLSKKRHSAAKKLTRSVNQQLSILAMSNADFSIAISSQNEHSSAQGIDHIEFMISTNPGAPHKSLAKVASGGELSRISLAIQVATAQTSHVATLVFDEVDVGIGGATADVVGQLLATLGAKSQVLCVTHLAQVASKAHQHWQVSKSSKTVGKKSSTASTIVELNLDCQIEEIARMISGSDLSDQSLAHARQMLNKAS